MQKQTGAVATNEPDETVANTANVNNDKKREVTKAQREAWLGSFGQKPYPGQDAYVPTYVTAGGK